MMTKSSLHELGEITFASGIVLVGDPCYINDKANVASLLQQVARENNDAENDAGLGFSVPTTPATVYVESGEYDTDRIIISFTGEDIRGYNQKRDRLCR